MSITIKEKTYLFDEEFQSEVAKRTWHAESRGYLLTGILRSETCTGYKETVYLHQLVMYLHYNIPLGCKAYIEYGYQIDHIDNNILDNRICNLQFLPRGMNQQKHLKQGSSKYCGVSWYKRCKWQAYIHVGKRIHLGHYYDETEAAQAYDQAVIKYGLQDFKELNFPKIKLSLSKV